MDRVKRKDRILKYRGAIVDVYDDIMEIPDGSTAHWDYIEHRNGAAAVLPVLEDGMSDPCAPVSQRFGSGNTGDSRRRKRKERRAFHGMRGQRDGRRNRISAGQPGKADHYLYNGSFLQ